MTQANLSPDTAGAPSRTLPSAGPTAAAAAAPRRTFRRNAAPRRPGLEAARAAEVVHLLPLSSRAAPDAGPAKSPAATGGVAALCARLKRLEGAYSPDEGTMDAIVAADRTALEALVAATSASTADVVRKLVALARRVDAADGVLGEPEQDLLRSAVRDLCRLDPAAAVA